MPAPEPEPSPAKPTLTRLRRIVAAVRESFWFVPTIIVLVSMAVAVLLVELDTSGGRSLSDWSPRLFGAGADGSRAMLSAIATSMITVAGVVFSITVVVLSQASTQYSPRVLRNFMRDRPTQAVLGVFVGVFAYTLIVLRTVRGGDDHPFIPSLAVLGGMGYAFAGIAMLIFFIHHVAQSIQASTIVERIAEETRHAIDKLFPQELADPPPDRAALPPLPAAWSPVTAERTGYVVSVEAHAVLTEALDSGRVVRVVPRVGEFVAEGGLLVELSGDQPVGDARARRLRAAILLGPQRSTVQDAGFGLQQLVDVALKALSPGINDPSTAALCIDRLGALLARLGSREFPAGERLHEGRLCVVAPAPRFPDFVAQVFVPLLAHARGDVQVLGRVVHALRVAGAGSRRLDRIDPLLELAQRLRQELRRIRPRVRALVVLAQLDEVLEGLEQARSGPRLP